MWRWKKKIAQKSEELWRQRVGRLPGAVFSSGMGSGMIQLEVYTDSAEEAIALEACYGGHAEAIQTVDWVAATAPEHMPPLMIRQQIVLSACEGKEALSALKKRYPRRHILSFPATRAFGTGHHATTATCLRMLCDEAAMRKQSPWTAVDIGCGTGILALAAIRLGAARVSAFDFDPIAVEVAKRNIERNGGAPHLELYQADLFAWEPRREEQGDIVMANLFSTVLQKAFPRILLAMKPSACLLVSGILNTQAEETLLAAQKAGLRPAKIVSRGKWTTAKLVRA